VTFTRVGAVYPDAAKVVIRYPPVKPSKLTQVSGNITAAEVVESIDDRLNEVRIQWRQFPTTPASVQTENWKDGPIVSLTAENDWVSTVRLSGLYPSTIYEYRLTYLNKTVLPYPSVPIAFRTFPDPRYPTGSHFRFIATSCATPNFPYMPFNGRTIKGFDLLASYLWPKKPSSEPKVEKEGVEPLDEAAKLVDEMIDDLKSSASSASESVTSVSAESSATAAVPTSTILAPSPEATPPAAEFLLFLGDFIYADGEIISLPPMVCLLMLEFAVPAYFGDDKEAYRRLYRRNYNSPSFRKIYEQLRE
jgi:alkaline phosphatase D